MNINKLRTRITAGLFAMLVSAGASAAYIEVSVLGTSGPWDWTPGGQNDAYQYGPALQNFTPPTVVDLASIGSGEGLDLFILYTGGMVNPFVCCGGPFGPSGEDTSTFKDDVPGSTGTPFPSFYMPNQWGSTKAANFNSDPVQNPNGLVADPAQFGVFLAALVAALTDSSGNIVGSPFAIGDVSPFATNPGDPANDSVGRAFGIGVSFQVPVGVTRLNLGINDDTFIDNSGFFNVCVASSQADMDACAGIAAVPAAGTLALFGIALGAALWDLRRRRRMMGVRS